MVTKASPSVPYWYSFPYQCFQLLGIDSSMLFLYLFIITVAIFESISVSAFVSTVRVLNYFNPSVSAEAQISYDNALQKQKELFKKQVRARTLKKPSKHVGSLMILQHKPVYTFGSGTGTDRSATGPFTINLRDEDGKELPYDTVNVDRGGKATFHGPGQIVLYPILDLERFMNMKSDIHVYLRALEEVVIDTCTKDLKLTGVGRMEGYTGVWTEDKAKLAAIGVKISQYITMHGMAVNYDVNMKYFDNIRPCGLTFGRPGNIKDLIGKDQAPAVAEVANLLLSRFADKFNVDLVNCND